MVNSKLSGGYAMIDCTGLDLTGSKVTITGIFKALTNAVKSNKPIITYNITGVTPVNVSVANNGDNLVVTSVVGAFTVASDDEVTPVSPEESTKSVKSTK